MKKAIRCIAKCLSVILLIMSILLILFIVIWTLQAVIVDVVRIMFFGLTLFDTSAGGVSSIGPYYCYGIAGLKKFFLVWVLPIAELEIPIVIVSIIYIIIYFEIIRKKLVIKK